MFGLEIAFNFIIEMLKCFFQFSLQPIVPISFSTFSDKIYIYIYKLVVY